MKARKRTEIDDIMATTEQMLLDKGAKLDNPNASERRFVCNQVVRHSHLSRALASLGITQWEQIKSAYFRMPGASFYRYIMWLYYINEINPTFMPDRGIVLNDKYMLDQYEAVRDNYYALRRDLHQRRNQSMNVQGAQNRHLASKLSEMLKSPLKGKAFIEEFADTSYKGLYMVCSLVRMDLPIQSLRDYVDEHLDAILQDFCENGYTRHMLSLLHRVRIPNRNAGETVVDGRCASDEMIVEVLGIGHDEINFAATEYQDDLKRKLDLMEHWQYLTDLEPYFDNTEEEITQQNEDMEPEELEQQEVLASGSLTEDSIPRQVMDLARRLAKKHGPVHISSESSGLHIHLADPELLRTDGVKELTSRHLTINADKYFGLDAWDIDQYPTQENRAIYRKYRVKDEEVPCASSMKTGKTYMVSDLLAYAPLSKRHNLFGDVKDKVIISNNKKKLVYDENGNLVPQWVGHTIPITQLPPNHPAVEYLTSRGYDLPALEQQFETCYCDDALPESRGEGRYYSRLPGGMKNSPQGRIIFSVRMDGVRHGYQSRYIDKWNGPLHYFWSDEQKWVLVGMRNPDGSIREVYPPDDIFRKGFAPHKYMNAVGSERNKLLMGYDAAVAFNKDRPPNRRYCVLVEGPLDAARIGPPALALLGKSISKFQAEEIRKEFTHVLTVMDNDTAGRQGLKRIHQMLEHNPITDIQLPDGVKDVGELSYEETKQLIEPYVPK